MDEPRAGESSRPPTLEDVVGLCRSLNAERVRYVVIGGVAAILHGALRGTKNVDLLVDPSAENVRALKRAMACLPDNAVAEVDDDDVRTYQVVRVGDEILVDLLASACGVRYEDAVRMGVDHVDIDGVPVPIASKEVLILTKDTVRPSDRMDVDLLRSRIDEEKARRG
ncbi:MAG: nucleotidyltransferase [Deltaproteobacteria bacterium]|nr:nucleotidyltransferase [Deltaproteobacteria bacterium]